MLTRRILELMTIGFILGACSSQPAVRPNLVLDVASRAALQAAFVEQTEPQIGVVSYWGIDPNLYNQLPEDSLALINPASGIFNDQGTTLTSNLSAYQTIVAEQYERGVNLLGYVPIGFFNHDCDIANKCQTWSRIKAQVEAYFANMPELQGIFFDEAAPSVWDCAAFVGEYQQLREIVYQYNPDAMIAFNPGAASHCVVDATEEDEIVVLFENDQAAYFAQAQDIADTTIAAQDKGVLIWHLIHSVKTPADMDMLVKEAQQRGADYVYVTDTGGNWQAGENTWGSPPPYLEQEVTLLDELASTLRVHDHRSWHNRHHARR
jgi:hypothetical protein